MSLQRCFVILFLLAGMVWTLRGIGADEPGLPQAFVYLDRVDASIQQDIRYAGHYNFLGRPVRGYQAPRCILTRQAAQALARVQAALKPQGFALKVYDCYRPQRAVDDFVQWAGDLTDTMMEKYYYPDVPKSKLFEQGYIAQKSSHSRGSTVDLSMVALEHPVSQQSAGRPARPFTDCTRPATFLHRDNSVDMGTAFDCFDPLSRTDNPAVSETARQNRLVLKSAMEAQGFRNLPEEWWHYTLVDEPFPHTAFDFPVE